MNVEEVWKGYEGLSADDQRAIGVRIIGGGMGEACCPGPMKEHLRGMMKTMESSEDPLAMCQEMMRMCMEKMTTSAAGGCA
jgi:hypothetical protein